ncbi:MAG: ACP S-malonyltransferase [Clostridiales bacterium]|nr:ACP S-malonyltransferase [Clostridiales bacterium]
MMKIAFVYPGQGVQKVGMAQDFVEKYGWAKDMVKEATEASGFDMEKILFEENEDIHVTEYTQPCLVTACSIMTKAVEDLGIKADVTAGLSLGEYCALVTAGAMTFKDAVRLTRIRGDLMSSFVPAGQGTMAAIIALPKEKVEQCIDGIEGAEVANYNCPGQIVITGEKDAVHEGMEKLSEMGAKRAVELKVSGPFHSPMLKGAGEKLRVELDKAEISNLKIPYIANYNAELIKDTSETRDLLEKQVYSSVMWEQTLVKLKEMGVDVLIEIGPGKTIAGFVKKTIPEVPVINVSTVEEAGQLKDRLEEIRSAKEA